MVQTATKPPAEADTANDRLQVREVVNAAQREKILRFRDRIMVEERGVEPDAMSRREQLDQAARDEAVRHLSDLGQSHCRLPAQLYGRADPAQ